MAALKPPCDEGVVRSREAAAPCAPASGPWVLAATIIGSAMAFIDGTVVNVALPEIQARLGATAVDAQWIVESYALFLAALILVGGSLGDHYGRRRIYSLGIVLFAVASVGCGIAAALGPVLGGYLVENVSWRAAFLINVPLAVVVLLIVARHVPESRDPDARRLDVPGAVLATAGLGGIVFGLIESQSNGFGDPLVLASLALGLGALAGFVFVERRSPEPMMPLTLFHSRNFSGANLLTLFLYAGLGGALYFLPFNLIQVHGYSATAAGSAFLPFIMITFVMSRWAGGLVTRYGAKLPLMIGPTIAAAGFVMYALPGTEGFYWTTFFPAVVVQGFGMALVIAPLTTTALNSVSGRHSGLASGVNNAVARTAGLLAIPILGVFVLAAFSTGLDSRVENLDLPPQAQQQLEAEKVDLGAAEVSEGVGARTAARIESAVDEAFLGAFRLAMLVAAGLAPPPPRAPAPLIGGKGRAAPAETVVQTEGGTAPA